MKGFPNITKTVLKSLFGKPATLMYPQRKRTYSPATRGKVQNDIVRCIFCRMCERNCPTEALFVSKERKEWQIDSLRCCYCRRCVEVCPVKCLIMRNVYFPLVHERKPGLYLVGLPPKPPNAEAQAPEGESGPVKAPKEQQTPVKTEPPKTQPGKKDDAA